MARLFPGKAGWRLMFHTEASNDRAQFAQISKCLSPEQIRLHPDAGVHGWHGRQCALQTGQQDLDPYAAEKAEGTELPAILGRLREYVENEEVRLFEERQRAYRQSQEDIRVAQVARLLSGAD